MDYQDFINELKPLIEEARFLFDLDQIDQDPRFRKWRFQLVSLLDSIEDRGYEINCDIQSRIFRIPSYDYVSKRENLARYNQELQDTLNELETIVSRFEKYGDPKAVASMADKSVLVTPSETVRSKENLGGRMSLKEKFESHPIVWGLTLITIGFGAGFTVRSHLPYDSAVRSDHSQVSCHVEGVERLETTHHMRMEALQKELLELEKNASDRMFTPSIQNEYKDAANRVRQDISTENTSYLTAIELLSKKCQ